VMTRRSHGLSVRPGQRPGRSMDPGSHADFERRPHDQVNAPARRVTPAGPRRASARRPCGSPGEHRRCRRMANAWRQPNESGNGEGRRPRRPDSASTKTAPSFRLPGPAEPERFRWTPGKDGTGGESFRKRKVRNSKLQGSEKSDGGEGKKAGRSGTQPGARREGTFRDAP
jgi:hypothetical protein